MRSDAVAIVPVGGAARRLGPLAPRGKAMLVAGGRTFLDRVCAVLADEVARVIVVAAPGGDVPATTVAVEVIRDSRPGSGPLAAVRDGLAHASRGFPPPRWAVLCSGDVPLVARGVIRLVLERASRPGVRWALPEVGGHPQPLLSVLAVDLLPDIEAHLAAGGGSLRRLADALAAGGALAVCRVPEDELRGVDPDLHSFLDVDTPADLDHVVRRAADQPRRA